jgi:hypothetical protein
MQPAQPTENVEGSSAALISRWTGILAAGNAVVDPDARIVAMLVPFEATV